MHVDTIDPASIGRFEAARRAWLDVQRAGGFSDARGYFVQAGNVFYTLHPVTSFGDLDALRAARRAGAARAPKEALARYDRESDASLMPPHRSEVWVHEADLDYAAPGVAADERAAGAVRVVVEELDPGPRSEGYEASWNEIKVALTKARYPLARVVYSSVYGAGEVTSFWLAARAEDLAAAPSLDEAVAAAVGEARARELLATMRAGVVRTRTATGARRADLDSP